MYWILQLLEDSGCVWLQAGVDLGSVLEERYARSKKLKNAQAQVREDLYFAGKSGFRSQDRCKTIVPKLLLSS